jgi:aminoglycoside phosphotransferase (APT) family kinase protein
LSERLYPPRAVPPADLVRRLVDTQFPQWAALPLTPVARNGWDNTTYRLGDELLVRVPTGAWYAKAVEKEHRWLPLLAPHLPLPIPVPVAMGAPGGDYPFPWSVYRWLEGEVFSLARVADMTAFAADLAAFLAALQRIDATGGPPPGEHNFFRGDSPRVYDRETHAALATLGNRVDSDACREVWAAALASQWDRPPVWVHGDIAPGNLLLRDGKLGAVIDFGTSAIGDPACDLAIAFTTFSGASRAAFRKTLGLDAATWARGRGWTLWKALIVIAATEKADEAAECARVIREVIADHHSA